MTPTTSLECGYCGGEVVWSDEALSYVHTTSDRRVPPPVPGDFLSAHHNRAGSRVGPYDVVEAGDTWEDPNDVRSQD